jgi:hypothetical protein
VSICGQEHPGIDELLVVAKEVGHAHEGANLISTAEEDLDTLAIDAHEPLS